MLAEVNRSVTLRVTEAGKRTFVCLPFDCLRGWLFTINAKRVKPELKDTVVRYQRECYWVLADAFIGQVSPMTRSPTEKSHINIRDMALAIATKVE